MKRTKVDDGVVEDVEELDDLRLVLLDHDLGFGLQVPGLEAASPFSEVKLRVQAGDDELARLQVFLKILDNFLT